MSRHASLRDDSGPASPASLASGHSELRLNCESDLERVENWRTAGETIYKYSVELLLQPFTIFLFFKNRNAFDYLYLIFYGFLAKLFYYFDLPMLLKLPL